MPMTLVTGGAGFIGSHVVRALIAAGQDVRVLHLPSEDLRNLDGLPVELVRGDVTDRTSCEGAVAGCERVFHLAALFALWHRDPDAMHRVNVLGTTNVLGAAMRARVKRVVYTSSIAVFGGQGLDVDASEESPFVLGRTGDAYSLSKYESHRVAVDFARRGLDVTIVAPCGPLGPGDVRPTPTGRLLLSAVNSPVVLTMNTISNMIDVRDVAAGHLLAASKGETGETYLLGHQNVTMRELAQTALAVLGERKPIVCVPPFIARSAGRLLRAVADYITRRPPLYTDTAVRIAERGLRARCDNAVEALGLPQTPLAHSVRDALIWFADNGYFRRGRSRLLSSRSLHCA